MGLLDKLRQAGDYLRKLRHSRGPDSYFQYKRGRDYERKQANHAHEREKDSAEGEREAAERGREHQERYAREREDDS
jgi:hypothetical protein